jgi:membrane peptidoglycan carboxypeptidase
VNEIPRVASRQSPRERTQPSAAGMIAVVIWVLFAGLGFVLAAGSVAAFSSLSANLDPPTDLDKLGFQEESIIYDRTGTVELARFGATTRSVVTFNDIPPIAIDAQTAIEDKTFWDNSGFDPLAIISAGIDSIRGRARGASTITQQLVRQRLLPPDLVQDPSRQAERKLKEIIQSIRLTEAFPGIDGKKQIITAYLNQNYYGNQAYGIKAAAQVYFGVTDLHKLTLAQAAILAGLPKSPSSYDLVQNANEECSVATDANGDCPEGKPTKLVVPNDSEIVQRRNQILDLLEQGRTPMSGTTYSHADFEAAKNEEVVLAPQTTPQWIAPHFVWAVQKELATMLCGEGVPTCDTLASGGLRITSTLDAKIQKIAEKWVKAAAIVPNAKDPNAAAKLIGFKNGAEAWMKNLRGRQIRNGALVALDYQTGELIAYVGSADYYSTKSTSKFQAKFDVVGSGYRQPGSAFKPFNYLTAIDDGKLRASTMLMDASTDFGGNYSPADADNLERGPVRVRTALQFSLNIPSVKTMAINTPDRVFARAQEFGMRFKTETTQAGLSLALGVQEVRPVDLVTAYGTLANGGTYIGHTTILAIKNTAGADVKTIVKPTGAKVATPQAAYIVTDILAGNTNPKVNPFWGKFEIDNSKGQRRPATLKTGTNNDAKDLNAYGFIAPPTTDGRAAGEHALAVGAWNGNSDNSVVSPNRPVFSIDVTTFVWQGFMAEATRTWAINDFKKPDGLVTAKIDPFTGLQPTPGDKAIDELFIKGTEPKTSIPANTCGAAVLDNKDASYESQHPNWLKADLDWIKRAERGPGVAGGPNRDRTAYFYNGSVSPFGRSWGPLVSGHGCSAPSPTTTCVPGPTPDAGGVIPSILLPTPDPSAPGGGVITVLCPTPSPSASPVESPSEVPSQPPPSQPIKTPPGKPTPPPTPPPTPEPSAAASPAAAASPGAAASP